jgi:hypothetical protein
MQVSKAVLFAVLRPHYADDQPGLAQRLPGRLDTDDFLGCWTRSASPRRT